MLVPGRVLLESNTFEAELFFFGGLKGNSHQNFQLRVGSII